ncbi:Protein ALP1-like [Linum perenne]
MARCLTNGKKAVAAAVVLYFQLMLQFLMFMLEVCEELSCNLIASKPTHTPWETPLERQSARDSFMRALTSHGDVSCIMLIRMNRKCFLKICNLLRDEGGLRGSCNMDIHEMAAIFLYTIAHNEKNRQLQVIFRRSGETISRVINIVLQAILKLHHVLLRKPLPIPENSTDNRWKYFKNCIGALDGTIITVRATKENQERFRTRKGTIGINVLGVCDMNMEFIYCLAGWEGSAHDGRVLRDAITRSNGLRVPKGQYYLCDAGYSNSEGFLAPFRGQRYHLKEWGRNRPRTPEEIFNMRHSSARNTIERAFGILKMRWAILRDTTWFSTRMVARIVNACCLLHNFIRGEVGADVYERLYVDEDTQPGSETDASDVISSIQPTREWTEFRQQLAQEMWENRGCH